ELAAIMERTAGGAPDYSVEAEGSVRHTVWTIGDAGDIAGVTSAFDRLGVIYIADGHHRSAAAARVAARLRQGDAINEADPFERFLIVSFPYTEVRILDYNRIVRDLNGLSVDEFLKKISGAFEVTPVSGAAKPDQAGQFGLYVDGAWYALKIKSMPPSDLSPAEKLDISILTRALLEPVLGIGDPRVDPRIDFVGGIRGMAELERRVDGGEWAAAFALYPTSLSDLMDVADAGQVMPPKSTWFEPKLADGLISLPLD
ncbi:MAG: DUF1015 domain-containing protein, partial [Rhodospirillales bacterium]|nr:DUF1015 domain-containing protein [Rhodospirillales bacterium]